MSFNDEDLSIYRSRTPARRPGAGHALLPSQRKWATSVTMAPPHGEYALAAAERAGYKGNLSAGIGICIQRCIDQEKAALAAIKQAAEARDQAAVSKDHGQARDAFDD